MKQQIIIDQIKFALATVTTTNGFYSNIGTKVTEGKSNPFGENRMDGVDVIDGDDDIETTTEAEEIENHKLQIIIKTIAKSPLTPETARKQIADVRKAMKALLNDTWWIANVRRWTNSGNKFEVEQAGVKIIGTESIFIIEFDTLALEEA